MIPIWHGCYDNNNFGDYIGKYVIEKLTNQETIFVHPHINTPVVNVYSGSVLQEAKSNWNCYGLGFGEENQRCKEKPNKVYSVRGKLSRNMLLKQNIECPEIFFDICDYLPFIYYPKIEKQYKYGFIPHYLDYNEYKVYQSNNTNVIDITLNAETVINEMLKCEQIISTSLHGLILADVYNVPNKWEKSKSDIGEFKFYDYYSKFN